MILSLMVLAIVLSLSVGAGIWSPGPCGWATLRPFLHQAKKAGQ